MRRTRRRTGLRLFVMLILTVVAALLFALTVLTARAAAGLDPEGDVSLLDDLSKTGTTRLYTVSDGGEDEYETVYAAENRIWCDSDEIPDVVKNALISIEDKRFYSHHGVDWLRTGKAFLNYVFHYDPPFGGSTITQQLVKNVSGENDVKSERKIREILRALRLEKNYTKDEILTFYLNVIPLANRCYGIGAASAFYFGKTPSELTAAEAATLAATTNAPARYDPLRYPEQNAERRNLILSKMEEYGFLTSEEATEARKETVVFTATREDAGTRIVSWYTEAVLSDVIRDLISRRGLSEGAATALVYRGGLEIEICCDPAIQRTAERVCRSADPKDGNLAVWVVDPGSGETLAVIGGAGEKRANRGLNYATDAPRPPGSALKPLSVYAPALRAGLINWATVFEDLPVKTLDGEPWPHNANGVYDGRIGVHEAIAFSKNTVAVSVLEKLGKRASFEFLRNECGITSLVENETDGAGRRLTDLDDAPLALGQLTRGVTLRELSDAYSIFAGEGVFTKSVTYRTVKNRAGEILLENQVNRRRVLSPSDAAIMTGMLSETAEYGTARTLTLPSVVPTAGKTGTTTGSSDRWFIGYTPTLLCGVLSTSDGGGDGSPRSPLPVWDAIMKAAHAPYFDGTDEAPVFPVPSGVLTLPFCRDSGDAPGEYCGIDTRGDRIAYGLFTGDNRPGETCRLHRPILYDQITGEKFADDGTESPYLTRFSAPDGSERRIPDGITPNDRAYDYDVLLGEDGAPKETPDGEDGTAVSGGLGEWERLRARERFRFGPRWFRHFFDP